MSFLGWLQLERRVTQLEKELTQLKQLTEPLQTILPVAIDFEAFSGEVVSGKEVEEEAAIHEDESVEEREYREEQNWLSQRKQKAGVI